MSLLLDALKKAADDKKKVSQGDAAQDESAPVDKSEPDLDQSTTLESKTEASSQAPLELESESPEELSLELDEMTTGDDSIEQVTEQLVDNETGEDAEVAGIGRVEDKQAESLAVANDGADVDKPPRNYKVSDDALTLLIHNTNREVKRRNRTFVFGILAMSLIVLVTGGVYYYLDMQAEIANLERKHQIAMQSMRSKTNNEVTPEKSELIRNLVGDSGLDEKVQYVKQRMVAENAVQQKQQKTKHTPAAAKKTSGLRTGELSIEKVNKSDPVGDKLDAAWLAYDRADYDKAEAIYKNVLKLESNNRDALLGLGAIAVIEKDNTRARVIYMSLLELDPRDTIATAAIASLRSDASSLASDEKYIVSMLQKNPDAPHLNFTLGNIYAQQSKWKLAQQVYFSAWQVDNENADYIFNLAVSLDQLGKHEQALTFYKDSLFKSDNNQVSFSREVARNRINELSGL